MYPCRVRSEVGSTIFLPIFDPKFPFFPMYALHSSMNFPIIRLPIIKRHVWRNRMFTNKITKFLLLCSVLIALYASCAQEPDTTAPGTVSNLNRASYENGVYRFTWTDPTDSDLASITVTVQPVGEAATVNAGVESAGVSIPSTEQILLASVVAIDGAGNESDPVYMIFPGEHTVSKVEFYDSSSNLTGTNVYAYDTNGIETGFTSYSPDPDGTVEFVRERTDFSDSGVFTTESDYDNSDNRIKYSVLSITNETRTVEFSEYNSSEVLQYTLTVTVPVSGEIEYAEINDASGNLLQRQYATYDGDGYLTSYLYRDSNDVLLETEEFIYDSSGALSQKEKYDSNTTLVETLKFIP
jgi:hypothetical protein